MQPKAKRPVRTAASGLDHEAEAFYETMSALLRAYQLRERERARDHGINITECYGLELIVAEGPMPVKELARRLRLDKSSASRTAASLERGGYVKREDDAADLRAWKLKATAKARALNRRIRDGIVARQKQLLARIDPRSRKQIVWLLGMLTAQEIAR